MLDLELTGALTERAIQCNTFEDFKNSVYTKPQESEDVIEKSC